MVSGRLYDPADQKSAKQHRAGMIRCDRFNRIHVWETYQKDEMPVSERKNRFKNNDGM